MLGSYRVQFRHYREHFWSIRKQDQQLYITEMTGAERKCRNRQILSEYAYGNIRHEVITFVVRHLYISRNIYTYERDINTFIWRGHSYIWECIHAYRVWISAYNKECNHKRMWITPQKGSFTHTNIKESSIHSWMHIYTYVRTLTHIDWQWHLWREINTYGEPIHS